MPAFRNPGSEAGNAIEAFFVQRAADERQRVLDELLKQKQADEVRQRQQQLDLQSQQETRVAQAQKAQIDDLAQQREFQRGSTVAENMAPGLVDPSTADLLSKTGFGGMVQRVDAPGTPGVLDTAGGTKWQAARAAEQARAGQATQAQAAALDRQREHDDTLAALRSGQNAGAAESRALRDQLAKAENDRKQEKFDAEKAAAAQATQNSANAQHELGQGILAELDRLQAQTPDKKGYALSSGAQSITGPARVPGIVAGLGLPFMGDATNASASLKGLIAKLDINKLRELKAQSKTGATGFGALSARELSVIENAAAMLDTAQTEDVFNERLNEIRTAAQKLIGAGGTAAPVDSGRVTIKSITPIP